MKQFYSIDEANFQIEKWACLRPLSPDGIPIVGEVPGYDNVFLHAGLGARGTNHSLATGELLAALMTQKDVPHKEEAAKIFSPARFVSFL